MKSIYGLLFLALSVISVLAFTGAEPTPQLLVVSAVAIVGFSFLMPKGVLSETISVASAREPFTNAVVAVFNEEVTVPSFFRSFFRTKFSNTKNVTFAVKRTGEQMAIDIYRGTGTNLNQKRKSTIKTLTPPYYSEGVLVNQHDLYDTAWASLDPTLLGQVAADTAMELVEARKLIERRYEFNCREVFLSGIVTLKNGDNIDFRRKTESMPSTTTGEYWTVATVDPMVILDAGGKFLREVGKAQGLVYNVILGEGAFRAMENNPIFQEKYDIRNYDKGVITMPKELVGGATSVGYIAGASYTYNLITYPEVYEDENGVMQPYMPSDKIIILPVEQSFDFVFAQVPMLPPFATGVPTVQKMGQGEFFFKEYIDPTNDNHVQEVRSTGVPVPSEIDKIYTRKVIA